MKIQTSIIYMTANSGFPANGYIYVFNLKKWLSPWYLLYTNRQSQDLVQVFR